MRKKKNILAVILAIVVSLSFSLAYAGSKKERKERDLKELQERFQWWPTDATPGPVKDQERGGYWWWPNVPGTQKPWGNRGYIYLYKIIFDYKEEELPPPQPQELRPSLLIKSIHKNVKIYFDYDSAQLRQDAQKMLEEAVRVLQKNTEASILVTGNCDQRGSEAYNMNLGKERALAVKNFMLQKGILESRILIISRGKLDAVAPLTDLVGLQKDRNAHFVIADVEEVMIPYPGEVKEPEAKELPEGKYIIEKQEDVESEVKVSLRQYTIKKNDSLSKIAEKYLGAGHRWKYLYEFNKEIIKDPHRLKAGVVINIPVESQQQAEAEEMPQDTESATEEKEPLPLEKYTIGKNDSLWKIAKEKLGDPNRWKEIYELNKESIKDPNRLKAGQVISLPAP